jgi:HJR/Mrr/RecB family endonuclease
MAKKKNSYIGLFIVGIIVFAIAGELGQKIGFSETNARWAVIAIIAAIAVAIYVKICVSKDRRLRALQISNIDKMAGHEFEGYVKSLLAERGFYVQTTKTSGDLGVDLTAEKNGQLVSVQIKRQSKPVSRRAVSDAVAGMAHYKCNAAMVITNNYFTPGAKELAKDNRCELVDRDTLTKWIVDFQSKSERLPNTS